ncbi:MAG: hypothetical protein J6W96_02050 [Alphaproteobacteria bacterium]|nr:hypothetical protein [Alphaproteobacteria bacterium]
MKKISFLAILFLMGCSSTIPQEDVYIDEEPMPNVSDANSQTIGCPNCPKHHTRANYSGTQDGVFDLLERNNLQVKRIYAESTKKITIKQLPEEDSQINPQFMTVSPVPNYEPEIQTENNIPTGNYFPNNANQLVYPQSPLNCGYNCTVNCNFMYLNNTNYICQ